MSIDCRFLALSHNSADLGQIIAALKDVPAHEDVVYLRKDDVVRLIRAAIEDASTTADNMHELADTLERIER